MLEELLIEETIDGHKVALTVSGQFWVDGEIREWYKDTKTNKPWIPKKRQQVRSLIKQIIRE